MSSCVRDHIDVIAQLADLKEGHSRLTLALAALIALLADKGIVSMEELEDKALEIDMAATTLN